MNRIIAKAAAVAAIALLVAVSVSTTFACMANTGTCP